MSARPSEPCSLEDPLPRELSRKHDDLQAARAGHGRRCLEPG
jgi:hypothetical protein